MKKVLIGLVGFSVVLLIGLALGQFHYSSYCGGCGKKLSATKFQLPMTGITLFESSSQTHTPFSSTLLKAGHPEDNHDHDWLFVGGTGNWVRGAHGKGQRIEPIVTSEAVVGFLRGLIRAERTDALKKWTSRLLNPDFAPLRGSLEATVDASLDEQLTALKEAWRALQPPPGSE